jgi:hypothetical protein
MKEASVDTVVSSVSLLSVDDTKMMSNTSSILDPGAPIFIPRQSRQKSDDDNETVKNEIYETILIFSFSL